MLRFYSNVKVLQEEVTGTQIEITNYFPEEDHEVRFLVDCGYFQESEYFEKNSEPIEDIDKIDFVLVTHAHMDHIGRLLYLVKQGYTKPIYATRVTKALSRIALYDAVKLNYFNSGMKPQNMLYNSKNVLNTLKQMETVEYGETFNPVPEVEVTFFQNGHLPGAACIQVKIFHQLSEKPIVFFFTGDYKDENIFCKHQKLPEDVLNESANIIIESTYGSTNTSDVKDVFDEELLEVLHEGKSVIIPAISNYRLQERMFYYKKMVEEHPELAGIVTYHEAQLSRSFNQVYKNPGYGFCPEAIDFEPTGLTYIDMKTRSKVFKDKKQKVIFTSSGDGTHGPAGAYVYHYLDDPNTCIYFSSHQFEGSVGERCLKAQEGELVNLGCGRIECKKADVRLNTGISGHARGDELLEFLHSFKNKNSVMINHGERKVQEIFKRRVEREENVKRVELMTPEKVIKVGPWGIIKTFKQNNN